MNEINEIFDDFTTDVLTVSDFGIQYCGACVDTITRDEDGTIHIYGGNPYTDKYSEEFLPTKEEAKFILEQVIEHF